MEERDRRRLELEETLERRDDGRRASQAEVLATAYSCDNFTKSQLAASYGTDFEGKGRATRGELLNRLLPSCTFNETERNSLECVGREWQVPRGGVVVAAGSVLNEVTLVLMGSVVYEGGGGLAGAGSGPAGAGSGLGSGLGSGVGAESGVGSCLFEPLVLPRLYTEEEAVAPVRVTAAVDCLLWSVEARDFAAIAKGSLHRVRQEVARILVSEPLFSGIGWMELERLTHLLVPRIVETPFVLDGSVYLLWQGLIVATDLSNERREQYYESDVFSVRDFGGGREAGSRDAGSRDAGSREPEIQAAPREKPTILFCITEAQLLQATGCTFAQVQAKRQDVASQDVNLDSVSVMADNTHKKKKKKGLTGALHSTVRFLGGKKKHSSSRSVAADSPSNPAKAKPLLKRTDTRNSL
ncbi:hypothetical protein GNI_084260 [Gregarina niphandrodes]|uniref:Uncharacterized protein n=1 Tax=Gregarina niphandrodes TaxID=110365 RepID=A0A023B620_GRENI|nr:hypothetical protein GNI_084260 [Gregarina niphandrodes]EZG65149.1 hypothetical protein GNI_084260 [Gregarina niphandrodes]|eukprot:XP_011134103.1 hypothetical protein GNI_084260 [Gregarina niphandrodes]